MEEGDTYIEAKALLERTIILLESARQIELDPALVAKELTNLIQEDKVQNVRLKSLIIPYILRNRASIPT